MHFRNPPALYLDISFLVSQEVSRVIREAEQRTEAGRAARICKELAHARKRCAEAIGQVDMDAMSILSV